MAHTLIHIYLLDQLENAKLLLFELLFLAYVFQNQQKLSLREVRPLISLQLCTETWQAVSNRPLNETNLVSESDLQHGALTTDALD